MKWEILEEGPEEFYLVKAYGRGKTDWQKMCNAIVETFSELEDGPATHIHFYSNFVEAKEIWREIKNDLPDTIVSMSFDNDGRVRYCFKCGVTYEVPVSEIHTTNQCNPCWAAA